MVLARMRDWDTTRDKRGRLRSGEIMKTEESKFQEMLPQDKRERE